MTPKDKNRILPSRVWSQANVTNAANAAAVLENAPQQPPSAATRASNFEIGVGGIVTYEFAENIGGRVCVDVSNFEGDPFLILSYSASSFFAGKMPDSTGDIVPLDLPLKFRIKNKGINCVAPGFNRGAFKYLTIYIPETPVPDDGNDFYHPPKGTTARDVVKKTTSSWYDSIRRGIKNLRAANADENPSVFIKALWVVCSAYPNQPYGRAYNGYFESSSSLLNRVWYAGAWTLQLINIKPNEGCAIIQFSSEFDGTHPEPGAWYNNYTIANGTAVTTDGAKRDRMVWSGDIEITIPGIAVSSYDMLAVRNALDSLWNLQYSDGSLSYAGIPMGQHHEFSDTYHMHTLIGSYLYVLYSGDVDWIKNKWATFKRAVDFSVAKIDGRNLMLVTSEFDWIRPGMVGHNSEASAIALKMLEDAIKLAEWVGEANPQTRGVSWTDTHARLRSGFQGLWCAADNLYGDNLEDRGCNGSQKVLPQDGNTWALMAGAADADTAAKVSEALRNRWTKYGAPAVEFPNVISSWVASCELMAHVVAGHHDYAIELMELQWGCMMDEPGMTNSTFLQGYRMDGYIYYPAYPAAPRNSHAHGWASGPTSVLIEGILGIKLLTPLGKTWEIEPHITKWLGHVRGGFANGLGKFEVSIERLVHITGRYAQGLNITVPAGSSGTLRWFGQEIKLSEEATSNTQTYSYYVYPPSLVQRQVAPVTRMAARDQWRLFSPDPQWTKPGTDQRAVGVTDLSIMTKYWVPTKGVRSAASRGDGWNRVKERKMRKREDARIAP
ncbi:hypothetical protein HYALB_00011909 [Hymenoscyphus albidus]|uniref:Alpha-L-rhamnosidase six-hairpin glycosidase domain-containing protein n=1 Tax=Hymenoscyphus albidus TaxID=595503 RepID=A0A9N9LVK7_9HELO|nr:hypothetical protein HYALB_00011909 [Hymenoscyphus albidus]